MLNKAESQRSSIRRLYECVCGNVRNVFVSDEYDTKKVKCKECGREMMPTDSIMYVHYPYGR